MRRPLPFLVLSLFALPLSAGTIWFDPPNPDSRVPVAANIRAMTVCPPPPASVTRSGRTISITVAEPVNPCPPVAPPPDGFPMRVDLGVLAAGVYDVIVGVAPGILLPTVEATLPVQDAVPPFQVHPNVTSYGKWVTITGPAIVPACSESPCPAPQVTFGGKPADFVQVRDANTIDVRAPLHDAGVVDVTVGRGSGSQTAIAAFDYFQSSPTEPAFFEGVLFPVIINGPGAFGSNWLTETMMRNDNDSIFPVNSIFNTNLLSIPDNRPAAHSTNWALPYNFSSGYLLPVPRQYAPKLSFSSIVRDLSRQAEAFGTELPVVRENNFFDRPFTLLNVPADPRYRVSLRVYRMDGGSSLRLRIWPVTSHDAPLVDAVITLAPADSHAFAAIGDLVTTYPQLTSNGALRIEIDGSSQHKATWAFVSITNNVTQHVTVITPH